MPGSYMSNDNEDLSESKLRGDHLSDYGLMEQVKGWPGKRAISEACIGGRNGIKMQWFIF